MRTCADSYGPLVERIAHGDSCALATLYDATSSLILGLALRILGDRSIAEEVTADVYAQVWRGARRYDAARGPVIAWLLVLTRSRAIDRRRALGSQHTVVAPLDEALDVPEVLPEPDVAVAIARRRRRVQCALARLSAEQRTALELAYFHGLSHGEIATRLGVPLGTVKNRIRRGLDRLRDALDGAKDELP